MVRSTSKGSVSVPRQLNSKGSWYLFPLVVGEARTKQGIGNCNLIRVLESRREGVERC